VQRNNHLSWDAANLQGDSVRNFGRSMALVGASKQIIKRMLRKGGGPAQNLPSRLQEVQSFGSNPGNLRMFRYLPPQTADNTGLVVVLHGCTQTAAGYDYGAGWSTLADRYGFILLFPEQQTSNNPNGCFNWFLPEDVRRGGGEVLSIRQMIARITYDQNIDPRRIFITGLSAGGAMTSAMLASYPEIFAGGAIIAGLPYGAASNVQEAFQSMYQCPTRSAREWGDLVRKAAPQPARWPSISVWHGNADQTVIPTNAREILKQWTDVHGLPTTPTKHTIVDGYPRQVWINEEGKDLIESYTITQMAHGAPLATGNGNDECGAAGPFLLDVGISSSYHIAKFFGLVSGDHKLGQTSTLELAQRSRDWSFIEAPAPPRAEHPKAEDRHAQPPAPGIDIGAVITKALKTAGLLKDT
jgi:poly(hydroxyalkanoate) depolymerase family esterase